jgi:hypothetical protein
MLLDKTGAKGWLRTHINIAGCEKFGGDMLDKSTVDR